jgi:GWxTD domain-containing protein
MFRPAHKILAFFFFMLLLPACGPPRLSQQDFSSQLATPDNRLQPELTVYHTGDSSFLFFAVSTSDLLYKVVDDTARASFSIRYELHASFEATAILDSATYSYSLPADSSVSFIKGRFSFLPPPNGKAILKVNISDDFRKVNSERLQLVSNLPVNLQQKFVLTDTSGSTLVRNYVAPDEYFKLRSVVFGKASLLVRCYFRNFHHPAPPFSKAADPVFTFRPDSLFRNHEGDSLRLDQPGIYHFQPDTALKTGYTVFVFDPWFPEIKSPRQLIEPLRYITMRNEYEEMLKKPDPKKAAEEFWLKTGGRNDRSKALIRIYYQRVQEANRRFTSYVPGWKTDRGMIYVVFGPPGSVFRSQQLEQWTYNTESNGTIIFDFKPKGNPFTDNDFSLVRREEFDYAWYQSVERWRQGNISLRH